MWESFFEELEKRSVLLGTAMVGALTAGDIGRQTREQQAKLRLSPLRQQSQFKLNNPNQYQFEGGKHTDLKETTSPHLSLY